MIQHPAHVIEAHRKGADLFAGLGGFSQGASEAGLEILFAGNHNPDAIQWHEANHPGARHVCQDLQQFDFGQLPDISDGILLAAPCCQGYSQAGQPAAAGTGGNAHPDAAKVRRKHDADRATTWAVLAAMDAARPAALIVENVPDFLRWDLFPAWRNVLEAGGYHVRVHVLDARCFGSAQHRERVIVTAGRERPIDIDPGDLRAARTIADCLDADDDPANRWTEVGSKSERMRSRMRRAQSQAGTRCVWNNVSEANGRPLDGHFPTLTTKSGSQLYLLDGDRARILNPRELARAQSFPDHYALPRQRALASLLIGNAIDVSMARGVVSQTMEAL